ncbi:hypothetical protein E4U58_005623, partial [Claviceps cyperi]
MNYLVSFSKLASFTVKIAKRDGINRDASVFAGTEDSILPSVPKSLVQKAIFHVL